MVEIKKTQTRLSDIAYQKILAVFDNLLIQRTILLIFLLGAEEKDLDDLLADLCQMEEDTKAQLAAATGKDSGDISSEMER